MERDHRIMDRRSLRSDTDRRGFNNLPLEYVNLEAKGVDQLLELLPDMQEALGLTPATA